MYMFVSKYKFLNSSETTTVRKNASTDINSLLA